MNPNATATTRDPELPTQLGQGTPPTEPEGDDAEQSEQATSLEDSGQTQQQGGSPNTGAVDPTAPFSPGEGVTEDQIERSGTQ